MAVRVWDGGVCGVHEVEREEGVTSGRGWRNWPLPLLPHTALSLSKNNAAQSASPCAAPAAPWAAPALWWWWRGESGEVKA